MTHLADLHPVAGVLVGLLLILGACLTLIGSLGLVLLRDFYQRLHAPTLGASWGTGAIALASMLALGLLRGEAAIHELVIGVFVMMTTPIGLLLLGRAARRRDFADADPPALQRFPALPDAAEDAARTADAEAEAEGAGRL